MNKHIISNTYIIHCYISHSQNVRYFFSQLHTRAAEPRKKIFIYMIVWFVSKGVVSVNQTEYRFSLSVMYTNAR